MFRVDKKRDKMERQILDSQERAFWNVHRPPVSTLTPYCRNVLSKKTLIRIIFILVCMSFKANRATCFMNK